MSTEPSDDMQPGNNEPKVDDLLILWELLKEREKTANSSRLDTEQKLIEFELVDRHAERNGSKSTTTDLFKVSVKDERKAKCSDRGRLHEICVAYGIDEADMPIKASYTVDVKKLDAIKENHPQAYLTLAEVIERSAGKPGFSVKRK
jgi:hypothetical protein